MGRTKQTARPSTGGVLPGARGGVYIKSHTELIEINENEIKETRNEISQVLDKIGKLLNDSTQSESGNVGGLKKPITPSNLAIREHGKELKTLLNNWITKTKTWDDEEERWKSLDKIVFRLKTQSPDPESEKMTCFLKDFATQNNFTALSGRLKDEYYSYGQLNHLRLLSISTTQGTGMLDKIFTENYPLLNFSIPDEIIRTFLIPEEESCERFRYSPSHPVVILIPLNESETLATLSYLSEHRGRYSLIAETLFLTEYENYKKAIQLGKEAQAKTEVIKAANRFLASNDKYLPKMSAIPAKLDSVFQVLLELTTPDSDLLLKFLISYSRSISPSNRDNWLPALITAWKEGKYTWDSLAERLLIVSRMDGGPGSGLHDILIAIRNCGVGGRTGHKIAALALSQTGRYNSNEELGQLLNAILSLDGELDYLLSIFFDGCNSKNWSLVELLPRMKEAGPKLRPYWNIFYPLFAKLLRIESLDDALNSIQGLETLVEVAAMGDGELENIDNMKTDCRKFATIVQTQLEGRRTLDVIKTGGDLHLERLSKEFEDLLVNFLRIVQNIEMNVSQLLGSGIPPLSAIKVLITLANSEGVNPYLEKPWHSIAKDANFLSEFKSWLQDQLDVDVNGPEWRQRKGFTPCARGEACAHCQELWKFILSKRLSTTIANLSNQKVQHLRHQLKGARGYLTIQQTTIHPTEGEVVGNNRQSLTITKKPATARERREERNFNKEMAVLKSANGSLIRLNRILGVPSSNGTSDGEIFNENEDVDLDNLDDTRSIVVKEEMMMEDSE